MMEETSGISPFRIEISNDNVADLRQRLHNVRLPDKETVHDWSQGVPVAGVWKLDPGHAEVRPTGWQTCVAAVEGSSVSRS